MTALTQNTRAVFFFRIFPFLSLFVLKYAKKTLYSSLHVFYIASILHLKQFLAIFTRIATKEIMFLSFFSICLFLQVSPCCAYLTQVCVQKYATSVPVSSSFNNYTWDMSTIINRTMVSLTRFRLKQHLIMPRQSCLYLVEIIRGSTQSCQPQHFQMCSMRSSFV